MGRSDQQRLQWSVLRVVDHDVRARAAPKSVPSSGLSSLHCKGRLRGVVRLASPYATSCATERDDHQVHSCSTSLWSPKVHCPVRPSPRREEDSDGTRILAHRPAASDRFFGGSVTEALRQAYSPRRTGIVNVNVEPAPSSLFTQISPPWSSTNFRHRVSPSPVPSIFFDAVPTCRNASKTFS